MRYQAFRLKEMEKDERMGEESKARRGVLGK
jgi:hypothetical protein